MFYWLCQRSLVRPTVTLPGVEGVARHAGDFGPFAHAFRDAVQRQVSVARRVPRLFSACRPSTISRLVVAVVVDAVDFHIRRAVSHVLPELHELLPRFTDCDPTAAVTSKLRIVGIPATGEHLFPDTKRSGYGPDSGLTVRFDIPWTGFLATRETPATASVTGREASSQNEMLGSAFALAPPVSLAASADVVQCCQPSEREAGQVATCSPARHYRLPSMWASMMRRTSSATEMPRRLASRLRYARCGSVNEIICLVKMHTQSGHKVPIRLIGLIKLFPRRFAQRLQILRRDAVGLLMTQCLLSHREVVAGANDILVEGHGLVLGQKQRHGKPELSFREFGEWRLWLEFHTHSIPRGI